MAKNSKSLIRFSDTGEALRLIVAFSLAIIVLVGSFVIADAGVYLVTGDSSLAAGKLWK